MVKLWLMIVRWLCYGVDFSGRFVFELFGNYFFWDRVGRVDVGFLFGEIVRDGYYVEDMYLDGVYGVGFRENEEN